MLLGCGRKPENREETHMDMAVNASACLGLIAINPLKIMLFKYAKMTYFVLKHQHQLKEVITRHDMPKRKHS